MVSTVNKKIKAMQERKHDFGDKDWLEHWSSFYKQ